MLAVHARRNLGSVVQLHSKYTFSLAQYKVTNLYIGLKSVGLKFSNLCYNCASPLGPPSPGSDSLAYAINRFINEYDHKVNGEREIGQPMEQPIVVFKCEKKYPKRPSGSKRRARRKKWWLKREADATLQASSESAKELENAARR